MYSRESLVAAVALVFLSASVCRAQMRTWTDATGKYSVQAELVKVQDADIVLKRSDGAVVTVPLARLSQADRAFVKRAAGAPGAEEAGGGTQPGASKSVRLPLASRQRPYILPYRVVKAVSAGVLDLDLAESGRQFWESGSDRFSRSVRENLGHTIGLAGAPAADLEKFLTGCIDGTLPADRIKLFGTQVVDIGDAGQLAVRLGPAAAKQLKVGDVAFILQPHAGLEAAPDLVSLSDGRPQANLGQVRHREHLRTSINNVKQIGLAMHNFHDAHRYFPPAVIYGPDGKPWHSWRVLLLPYLEHVDLYKQYRFDEPWDGPDNKRLIEQVPPVYCDPIYGPNNEGYTHYALAVGPGTAFPPEGYKLPAKPLRTLSLPPRPRSYKERVPPGTTSIVDFKDGTSNSLLVGPVGPERKIPWTKPEDVVFDEHFPGVGKPGGFAAPYKTDQGPGGVFVRADGSYLTIRADVDLQALRHFIRIADQLDERARVDSDHLPSIPTPGRTPPALPVVELSLGPPNPTARLVLEPLQQGSHPGRQASGNLPGGPGIATAVPSHPLGHKKPATTPAAAEWTCSMHPQIKVTRPGNCPICGMSLVPRQAAKSGPAEQQSGGLVWTMDLSKMKAPDKPVSGRLHGRPFTFEKAEWKTSGWLSLSQGKDFIPESAVEVVLFSGGEKPEGKRFEVTPQTGLGDSPHVYLKWRVEKGRGAAAEENKLFMEKYAMILQFGKKTGGKLPGRIYICLPDEEHSVAAGTFTVPDPAEQQAAEMEEIQDAVTLEISGVKSDADHDRLIEILPGMTDPGMGGQFSMSSEGQVVTATLGPVKNVQAFARKITFGKVTSVEGRTIKVQYGR